MSHFSVAVFSNGDADYEELLKPYNENLSVPHYIPKEEIIAEIRKEIEDYKTGDLYIEYLKDPEGYVEKYSESSPEHVKYITQEFSKKLQWTDEECYADGVRYYDAESIKPNGSVFATYNPNARWDWYVVGGRFNKRIPLNDGTFCNEADMEDVNIEYRDTADASSCLDFYAAILPNGEWLEAGKMGWWGISFATPEDAKHWREQKKEIIRRAKAENWHITMVDCHI